MVLTAATFVAALKTLSFANVSSIDDLINLTNSYVDSFAPNGKVIDGANANNYALWSQGVMARLVGIFGSCPSTNAQIFGYDQSDLKESSISSLMIKLGPLGEGL